MENIGLNAAERAVLRRVVPIEYDPPGSITEAGRTLGALCASLWETRRCRLPGSTCRTWAHVFTQAGRRQTC